MINGKYYPRFSEWKFTVLKMFAKWLYVHGLIVVCSVFITVLISEFWNNFYTHVEQSELQAFWNNQCNNSLNCCIKSVSHSYKALNMTKTYIVSPDCHNIDKSLLSIPLYFQVSCSTTHLFIPEPNFDWWKHCSPYLAAFAYFLSALKMPMSCNL